MAHDPRFKTGKNPGGRPKGRLNKTTVSVKDALLEAFEKKGGVPALLKWAKDDPTAFYALWGRLAPREVNAQISGALTVAFENEARKRTAG